MSEHTATQSIRLVLASIASVLLNGVTVAHAAGSPRYPDIVEQISHLQVQNEHQREMLRFSTTHINIGDGPLQVRGGGQVAPCVLDGVAYAQCTHSTQEVLDAAGHIVQTHAPAWRSSIPSTITGTRATWRCSRSASVLSTGPCGPPARRSRSASSTTIRRSWSRRAAVAPTSIATRSAGHLGGMERRLSSIDRRPGARYHRRARGRVLPDPSGRPENQWLETDEFNNFAWVKFFLRRQGANPKVVIFEQSACTQATCGSPSNP